MTSDQQMAFTIGGKKILLSRKAVEAALKNVPPDPIKKYSVHIGNQDYPIKQVLSVASGVSIAAFVSTDAYRILTHLGFGVKE
jgi:copper chaperone CopZ